LLIVDDPEEIKAREANFKRQLVTFIKNYDQLWKGFLNELLARYEELKKCDVHNVSNIELLEHVESFISKPGAPCCNGLGQAAKRSGLHSRSG
jgi:hypothetical protein